MCTVYINNSMFLWSTALAKVALTCVYACVYASLALTELATPCCGLL